MTPGIQLPPRLADPVCSVHRQDVDLREQRGEFALAFPLRHPLRRQRGHLEVVALSQFLDERRYRLRQVSRRRAKLQFGQVLGSVVPTTERGGTTVAPLVCCVPELPPVKRTGPDGFLARPACAPG
jgi:hypothetical protein